MEFLLYLSPQGRQLIHDLISAKFHIYENVEFCRQKNVFGYVTKPNKFIICTKNIKNSGLDPKHYINETVYHESVHAAQICNNTKSLGIDKKFMPLSVYKVQDIKNSVKVFGDSSVYHREHEAYYLEDKPEKVRFYVRKFCF